MTLSAHRKPRARKCKCCREPFVPARPLQAACSASCAIGIAAAMRAKQARAEAKQARKALRERKEKAKTRSDYLKAAQAAVNRYVRLRDRDQGCISCDRPASWGGQWHASHFRSVGAASSVRFNTLNIHRACSICNHHLSGNIGSYKPRLVQKIGLGKVEWLEAQNGVVRYEIDYLKRIARIYTRRANRLAKMVK